MWWAQGAPGSDIDEYIDELRGKGWDEEAIALEYEAAARLAEPGKVWPEGWTAAQVFLACEWTFIPTFGGPPIRIGIANVEIESVCRLHRIPPRDRREVAWLIRAMANAAAPVLNEKKS